MAPISTETITTNMDFALPKKPTKSISPKSRHRHHHSYNKHYHHNGVQKLPQETALVESVAPIPPPLSAVAGIVNGSNDGIIPNDDYAFLRKADITLVLNTSDTAMEIGTLKFNTTTCLIYSENVIITQSIKMPGKNIGIFCNSITVVTTSKQSTVSIDVSGDNGDPVDPVTQGPGKTGNGGSSGGNIWFFVEGLTSQILTSLRFNTSGGDGSVGGSTSDPAAQGGTGGPGGAAGNITFLYGSDAWSTAAKLHDLSAAFWPKQASDGINIVTPALNGLVSQGFFDSLIQPFSNSCALYNTYATSLATLLSNLGLLIANPTDLSSATMTAVTNLQGQLTSLQASVNSPNLGGTEFGVLDGTSAVIGKWLDEDLSVSDADVLSSVKSVPVLSTQATSYLSTQFSTVFSYVISLVQNLQQTVQYQLCDAEKGNGGIGGHSGNSSTHPGHRGTDGTAGMILARNLAFDGRATDLAVPQAYCFPDQCQMLLNKADALYFSNTNANWVSASTYYQRLVKRLSFVPNLTQPVDPAKPNQFSSLYYSYGSMQDVSQITTSAIVQLQSVFTQAKARLAQLGAGQDMFGHTPNWCPRMSFNFYQTRVSDLISQLQTLETANANYLDALAKQTDTSESIQSGLDQIQSSLDKANDRISLLTDPNGVLQVSASQINTFTPQLKVARTQISADLAKVANDIKNHISFDPQTIIDALSMVAMCPTGFGVLTQAAGAAYKSWTEIKDNTGFPVDKNDIISQLATCENTFESLSDAFTTRDDDTIAVDDPGAMKIIASADALKDLVTKFKSAIPQGDADTLDQELDNYVSLINQRNNAVLTFNSALQLLQQALQDVQYYQTQQDQLGEDALKLDPSLPSVSFWMKKQMNDIQYDIMQRLNYEGRAIQYWGLMKPFPFNQPGPLRGSIALSGNQITLSNKFEDAYTKYSQSIWTWWPSSSSQMGQLYQFKSAELSTLKRNVNNVYGVVLNFDALTMSHTAGTTFGGRANVRLNQVRVWLLGAKVSTDQSGRKPLMVEINQSGNETILDPSNTAYSFSHDPVNIQFTYDATNVKTLQDCSTSVVLGTESIQNDFTGGKPTEDSMGPIGPFSQWRIQVKASENAGLDMSGVTAGYMEFWGRNMAFL